MTNDNKLWIQLEALEAILHELIADYDSTEVKRVIHAMAEEEDDKKKHNNKTI